MRPGGWLGQGTTGAVAYGAVLTVCLALSAVGLTLGALVAFGNWFPPIGTRLAAAAQTDAWAAALLPLTHLAESGAQLLLDYACSVAAIVLALALLIVRDRTWPVRLTALALVASA